MPINHTVRSFDEELGYLEAKIAKMGTFASEMIEEAVNAVVNNDLKLAKKVISDDMFLDETEREIDEKSVAIIAKRQPMAVDLREIIGAMRIAADLERVGDMGKNIAKRAAAIVESRQPASLYHGLQSFATLTLNQLKEVLDAYASRSLERIDAVRNRDEEIDAMYTSLFRELLTYMMEDPRNITACTHLLFCAKNIERIGDHATNIAEALHYIMTGTYLSTDRPRDDTTYKVGADEKTEK
ncbi:PhoU domain [Bartonella apihabitans]|uniref:phosphate signaling complex protein PhoU n=1 Tax=Bartonella TaxID=773 RepID=UPI0009902519|nr:MULTISPECIES: phosphate signaling complex protein PhoU [Bartonella]AQT44056.1 phosphate uptake regulator, PhoU [Bartonella apihabitans]MBH9995193.1 phosphate signaling complex protein PhoU [Bartonella sp. P0291]MBH9996462.1 phosphate signaling complex protein PhoU [Bartonella sp. M0192]MBH9998623.1 phosphate signaling complex protein PhoU [Bartonella sp. M0191]MBI0000777.1 phosphate signaling complex protein PhoU [Bartonella sp. W8122]